VSLATPLLVAAGLRGALRYMAVSLIGAWLDKASEMVTRIEQTGE